MQLKHSNKEVSLRDSIKALGVDDNTPSMDIDASISQVSLVGLKVSHLKIESFFYKLSPKSNNKYVRIGACDLHFTDIYQSRSFEVNQGHLYPIQVNFPAFDKCFSRPFEVD